MAITQKTGMKEFSSRSMGEIYVGQGTTSAGGDLSLTHGMSHTPFAAIGIPEGGTESGFTVTVSSTQVIIAGGGNAVKYTVIAFG